MANPTPSRPYSQFFEIDESYYPEINPNSIKSKKIEWYKTFPHETFIKFIEGAVRMITREDPHCLWVEGSYGTGKSRTMWALRNLLSCSEEDARKYFERYENQLEGKSELLDALIGFKRDKQRKILTVDRYDSGEIDSIPRLVAAVYDSVSEALVANGYKTGGGALRERVAEWLSNSANAKVFDIYRNDGVFSQRGSFANKTVQQIVKELRQAPERDEEGKTPADELLDDVLELADQKGIKGFSFRMEDLKKWLAEVIAANNLKAIVFFWDEFSSFFKKNKDSLDVFQSLVELSSETPFYLIIATHVSGALASQGERDDKKGPFMALYDRFRHLSIELPDSVAFDLIAEAMKIKPSSQKEYETLTQDINSGVMNARIEIASSYSKTDKECSQRQKTLARLIPIHPVSALLLKHIATEFASNQRSMFNFIKNDDADNLQAFQWYINNHSPVQGDILTVDYLWNFFYEKGSDERTGSVGKSNLDAIIAAILDVYPRYEEKLHTTEEKRVLKCVLMLQAISRKLNNGVEMLRPTDVNISRAFQGDFALETGVQSVLNKLENAKILVKDEEKKDGKTRVEYVASVMAGDGSKIDEIKERMRGETFTSTLLREGEINDVAFGFGVAIKARFAFEIATAANFRAQANRLKSVVSEYQIPALICFARDEDEQREIGRLIAQATQAEEWKDVVFIDASEALVGEDRFDDYLTQAAQEEYWRPTDAKTARNKEEQKKAILADWKNDILNGAFRIITVRNGDFRTRCGSKKILEEILATLVKKEYPLSFDDAKLSEFFFKASQLPSGAKLGVLEKGESAYNEKLIMKELLGKVKGVQEYWEVCDDEPISKLKLFIDDFINKKFEQDGRVAISAIFEQLATQGFMPINLYAYLAGFLLKEYADGSKYDYSVGEVGESGGAMTPDRLGADIGACIKQCGTPAKNFKEPYISIMSPGQKRFIEFAKKVFGITSSKVEMAATNMRNRFKDLAPIWCYKELPAAKGLEELLDKLCEVASSRGRSDSVGAKASLFGEKLTKEAYFTKFKALFTAKNGLEGVKCALAKFEGGRILELADELGISEATLLDSVKRRISSGDAAWLWDEETGREEFGKILLEYEIMQASEPITIKTSTFKECVEEWLEFAWTLRAPVANCKAQDVGLADFFDALECIAKDRQLPEERRETFLSALIRYKDDIKTFKEEKIAVLLNDFCKAQGFVFSSADLATLNAKLPQDSFVLSSADYQNRLKEIAAELAHNQERSKLMRRWQELTETNSPREWSQMFRTPILALVPEELQEDAVRIFHAINDPAANNAEVKFALEKLATPPLFIDWLKDQDRREDAFREVVIGRFSPVIRDADRLRNYLNEKGLTKPDEWLGSPAAVKAVKEFASAEYFTTGYNDVKREIDDMDPQEAKELLKTLFANNVEVGVSIIAKNWSAS